MTKKIYLETLKSVLGRSISHYSYSFIFTDFGQFKVILLSLDKILCREKQSKSSRFDKKLKNHA